MAEDKEGNREAEEAQVINKVSVRAIKKGVLGFWGFGVLGKIKAPPERSAALALKEKFGLELKDCSLTESMQLGYGQRVGLLVVGVEKNSPAAEAGIQKGMLVVGLGQIPARTLEELPRKVRQLKSGEQVPVTVLGANRQGNFIAIRSGAVVLKAR